MSSPRGLFAASVLQNLPLCREHYRLVLQLERFPQTQPGQFLQLSCRDMDADLSSSLAPVVEMEWAPGETHPAPPAEMLSSLAVLRRPFSLAGRRDSPAGVELDVIHRVVGVGTDWLSRRRAGDLVHVLGPLGNAFELPQGDEPALLVGGGVGIPPMLYLAERLAGRKAIAFAGALSRDLIPLTIIDGGPIAPDDAEPREQVGEFARHGIASVISTDDGSYGYRGFVTQALEAYLDAHGQDPPPTLYTCGPEPMMKRVADIANRRGLPCQIAVERAMACGMGTCQSCCIRIKKPDPNQPPLVGKDWAYRLACTDGPVFRAAELLW